MKIYILGIGGTFMSGIAQLAKEKGSCRMSYQTKYAAGIVPKDTYKKEVDELVDRKLSCNWDSLSADLKEHGIRNSTLMALMPSETSSQISNATNGIEPPRALVSIKQSKDGVLKQVVPGIHHLKNKYELFKGASNHHPSCCSSIDVRKSLEMRSISY